jgi:threonine dehydrogenase-like Zn-dependent dehydrogenase
VTEDQVIVAGGGDVRLGDVVVAAVRRGCGRCGPCRVRRADFCTGRYVEYGIHGRHGFARPLVEVEAENLVRLPDELWPLGVLAEPLAVVEKALDGAASAAERVPGERPERPRALVAGAGSLGLLAVFLLRLRGHEVVVYDRRPEGSRSGRLAAGAGARYRDSLDGLREEAGEGGFDLVLEATGSAGVLLELLSMAAPNGVVVVLGVSKQPEMITAELRSLVRRLVVRQVTVLPVVNASAVHLARAVEDLAALAARPGFREIVTGVHPPEAFAEALRPVDGIKECLEFATLAARGR